MSVEKYEQLSGEHTSQLAVSVADMPERWGPYSTKVQRIFLMDNDASKARQVFGYHYLWKWQGERGETEVHCARLNTHIPLWIMIDEPNVDILESSYTLEARTPRGQFSYAFTETVVRKLFQSIKTGTHQAANIQNQRRSKAGCVQLYRNVL